MKYVLGFAFYGHLVALIKKNKPEWQKGKFNGIGGKIEPTDQTPLDAMVREFQEETGCLWKAWRQFATMEFGSEHHSKVMSGSEGLAVVYCFQANIPDLFSVKTATDEEVFWINLRSLPENVIPNLRYLIPMALNPQEYPFRMTVDDHNGVLPLMSEMGGKD